MSHYDTLEVPRDADLGMIKRAFRKKAKRAHPDVGGDHRAMVALNRAYETLSDPAKRARYDETGEDRPRQSPDDKAREAVMHVFKQMVDAVPEGQNVLSAVRAQFQQNQMQLTAEEGKLEEIIKRLERQRKNLKHKGESRNFLDDLLSAEILHKQAQLADFDNGHKLIKCVFELLDEYEWTGKAPQYGTYGTGASMFQIFTTS